MGTVEAYRQTVRRSATRAGADRTWRFGDPAQGRHAAARCPRSLLIEYGKQDREPGEFVETVRIPFLDETDRFRRLQDHETFDEDISAVCGAFPRELDGDGKVADVAIAFGAWRARRSARRKWRPLSRARNGNDAAIEAGVAAFERDYTPLTDWRASSEYGCSLQGIFCGASIWKRQETRNIRIDRTVAVAM